MFEYGIGGSERKLDNANEAFADIQMNRTIFVQKLTGEAPYAPQAVYDLKTVDAVFNHFQPAVEVEMETEDGSTFNEQLNFNNLGDFGSKGIIKKSKYLQEVNDTKDESLKIVKELKSNKALQAILQNKENKEAFLAGIQAMIKELEEAGA
jgi:predicted component of type VI protein secretion system